MIVDLPDTTVSKISKSLVNLREEGGAVALGRVLTLVIATSPDEEEHAIEAAKAASSEHPMRVVVLSTDPAEVDAPARVDAQIRVGGDAGASEVVIVRGIGAAGLDQESLVMGLLLPDAPVVVWWAGDAPECVAESALGGLAQRRITDAAEHHDPHQALAILASNHRAGDSDFAWTRITLWRSELAAVLDQPPFEPVDRVEVVGSPDSPSAVLLAAWLALQLQTPVTLAMPDDLETGWGIQAVRLHRPSGTIEIVRHDHGPSATLVQPTQPDHRITLPRRNHQECLAEELRHLDPDELFEQVITRGLALPIIERRGIPATEVGP